MGDWLTKSYDLANKLHLQQQFSINEVHLQKRDNTRFRQHIVNFEREVIIDYPLAICQNAIIISGANWSRNRKENEREEDEGN